LQGGWGGWFGHGACRLPLLAIILKINYQTWVRVDLEDVPVVLLRKIQ